MSSKLSLQRSVMQKGSKKHQLPQDGATFQ